MSSCIVAQVWRGLRSSVRFERIFQVPGGIKADLDDLSGDGGFELLSYYLDSYRFEHFDLFSPLGDRPV